MLSLVGSETERIKIDPALAHLEKSKRAYDLNKTVYICVNNKKCL